MGLFIVFIQDVKSRAVYWVVFPVLFVLLGILHSISQNTVSEIWQPAAINIGFLLLQIVLLSVYFSLKNKRFTNLTDGLLGLGDILFLLSITVYLSVLNFLFFYIVSLVLVLVTWLIWQSVSAKQNKEVPLAGMQALILIIFLCCDWGLKIFNLTNDTWLLNLITK
ncbi:MAG TPA: hypothetical protein VL442_02985 [Mucilaginibacter sp.]|jgi:hypothetical protein|nr:hypothetical protein [Mucilaginibacter sp.]